MASRSHAGYDSATSRPPHPVVISVMARVVVRSELGTVEIDLIWGSRMSVDTRGLAEVLVEATSDAAITLDRRALNPFRRGGRALVTATLAPALRPADARRLEVREGRRVASVDLSAEEAVALGAEFRAMVETVDSDLPRLRGPFWDLDPGRRFVRAANPTRIATFLLDHAERSKRALGALPPTQATGTSASSSYQAVRAVHSTAVTSASALHPTSRTA